MPEYSRDYRAYAGARPDKFFKSTLFQGDQMLLGLNCLEAGQTQALHCHTNQDKFYYVIEGEGQFVVGSESLPAGPGMVIWAPAGIDHGVENRSDERLTMLVGMAPPPK